MNATFIQGCTCACCEAAQGRRKLGTMEKRAVFVRMGRQAAKRGKTLKDNPLALEENRKLWAQGFVSV